MSTPVQSLSESTPLLVPDEEANGAHEAPNDAQAKPAPRKRNHNVVLSLVVCMVVGTADSVWSSTVLVAFLYVLTGTNKAAGYVEASQGMATLLTALPVGYLADKYTRSSVVRSGGIIMYIAAGITSFAVIHGETHHNDEHQQHLSFYMLLGALALWGVTSGIVSGPLQALYADSIPTGQRSKYYVYLFASYVLANAMGPVVSIAVFTYSGNEWHLSVLLDVILVGMGLELVGGTLMWFFDDTKALGKESEHVEEADITEGGEGEGAPRSWAQRRRGWIPYILFVASVTLGLGAGMTVKFFPLYFKNDCKLSPVEVQTVYAILPVVMVAFTLVAQRVATRIGRAQTIVLCRGMGVAGLYAMVYLNRYRGDWRVMVPLYVVRAAAMNCTFPLEESILMDFVPKSLESVAQFGWCGSAALGGVLADHHGYSFTFLITAIVQSVAVLVLALLVPLVPKSEKSMSVLQS